MGHSDGPCRDRARHPFRRLADREDDGAAHHEASPRRGILRGDGRRVDGFRRLGARDSRFDDAHDHGRARRRRLLPPAFRGSVGNGEPDRRAWVLTIPMAALVGFLLRLLFNLL